MHEVVQDDYSFTFDQGVDALCTDGVNGCCGVAILNRTQGWAALLHYSDAVHQLSQIGDVLDEAHENTAEGDDIEIWFGGCDDSDSVTRSLAHESRTNLEDALKVRFVRVPRPEWLSRQGSYINVVVSTAPARIAIERF